MLKVLHKFFSSNYQLLCLLSVIIRLVAKMSGNSQFPKNRLMFLNVLFGLNSEERIESVYSHTQKKVGK